MYITANQNIELQQYKIFFSSLLSSEKYFTIIVIYNNT